MTTPKQIQLQRDILLIKDAVEEIRTRLLGDGDKPGYVERLRAIEMEQVRHQDFVSESRQTMPDLLFRMRGAEKWVDEQREFCRDAPGRLKDAEEWASDQKDFKRAIRLQMWGGMIGGGFSILVAIILAWKGM